MAISVDTYYWLLLYEALEHEFRGDGEDSQTIWTI